MNIPQETIEAEAKTIRHIPESYRDTVVSNIHKDSRFSEWDEESLVELQRLVTGEKEKMEVIPFNPRKNELVRRPSVSLVVPETDSSPYTGNFILSGGVSNRVLYSYSWKENKGVNPPTLRDLQNEVDNLNRSMDWRTRSVAQNQLLLGRDYEGYYVELIAAEGKSPWIDHPHQVMRPGERLYFTQRGVRKFFSQCVNGGISKLNSLEKSFALNRSAYGDAKTEERKSRLDAWLAGQLGSVQFNFAADNFCTWNRQYNKLGKSHQLLTFVGKNKHTNMFRRYIGHVVSQRYNMLTDADYIEHLIASNPELLSMPIIDCTVTDNLTRLRMLDESEEVGRAIVESGFNLHTPYKAFDGGNSQNSSRSAWIGGGQFQADCWNGIHRFNGGESVSIRKNSSAQNTRDRLSSAVNSIRLESQGIIEAYNKSQDIHVANFNSFLDQMRQGYKAREESTDGRTANPITDGLLEHIKSNIDHETNAGSMHHVQGYPQNTGCSVQRVLDAVTVSANRCVKEGRLLLSCHMQDFACSILEEASVRQREYALNSEEDDILWNGYVDARPRERSIEA